MLDMARDVATREQQILEHSLKLFSQGGYKETSLQDVADKLGLTRPAFYYYFKSKDELLWRLIGTLGDDLLERARPIAASSAKPAGKLRELMRAHVRTMLTNAEAFTIYFAERHVVGRARDRRLRRSERAYMNLVANTIAEGQEQGQFREGEPRTLALLALGLANSTLRWYRPRGALDVDQVADLVAALATDGLRRRRS